MRRILAFSEVGEKGAVFLFRVGDMEEEEDPFDFLVGAVERLRLEVGRGRTLALAVDLARFVMTSCSWRSR